MHTYIKILCSIFLCAPLLSQEKSLIIKKICNKIQNSQRDHCKLFAKIYDNTIGELFYDETEENKIKICHLRVEKEMRNLGIGTRLMNYLEDDAKSKNCPEIIVLSAARATGFYQKLGFTCEKDSFDLIMDNTRFCSKALKKCQQRKVIKS